MSRALQARKGGALGGQAIDPLGRHGSRLGQPGQKKAGAALAMSQGCQRDEPCRKFAATPGEFHSRRLLPLLEPEPGAPALCLPLPRQRHGAVGPIQTRARLLPDAVCKRQLGGLGACCHGPRMAREQERREPTAQCESNMGRPQLPLAARSPRGSSCGRQG